MEYYIHRTSENERWDTLASIYYGDCYAIADIIKENPHVPISARIKANTDIKIPVKEDVKLTGLPIWKTKN